MYIKFSANKMGLRGNLFASLASKVKNFSPKENIKRAKGKISINLHKLLKNLGEFEMAFDTV
jgi:hypothetical protein